MADARRFTIGDMMALVAAAAIGLTLDRWRAAELDPLPPGASGVNTGASHWLHALGFGRPSCFVVALALALIPLRWIRPRPSAARVLRQPGAVACLAVAATLIANVATLTLGRAIASWLRAPDVPPTVYGHWHDWSKAVHMISMGVGGAWAAMALGGRWSPERSWIDRVGVAVGLYWLATYFLWFFSGLIDVFLPYKP